MTKNGGQSWSATRRMPSSSSATTGKITRTTPPWRPGAPVAARRASRARSILRSTTNAIAMQASTSANSIQPRVVASAASIRLKSTV